MPCVTEAPLIELCGLHVAFAGKPAVRGIDLVVGAGEAIGLVGESGCGKSVTWLAALGLLPASAKVGGRAILRGEELIGAPAATLDRVRGGQVAMIFQDPVASLNPVQRVGRQVAEALVLHRGLRGAAARAEARRLFDRVGIPNPARRLDAYPHELSGGQNQRVTIAIALAGNPALLIADEPTTALDATIQAQILALLQELRAETGMALVLISHDLGVVSALADRIVVMYAGRIVEEAPADRLFAESGHPYTAGLLAALPPLDGPRRRLAAIPGEMPEPRAMPPGCEFAPRCPRALADCDMAPPALRPLGAHHRAACLHPVAAAERVLA